MNTKMKLNVTSLAEVWIEIVGGTLLRTGVEVTSLAEVWIEMKNEILGFAGQNVTSLAEVWIEIIDMYKIHKPKVSLPSRKCGLK